MRNAEQPQTLKHCLSSIHERTQTIVGIYNSIESRLDTLIFTKDSDGLDTLIAQLRKYQGDLERAIHNYDDSRPQ